MGFSSVGFDKYCISLSNDLAWIVWTQITSAKLTSSGVGHTVLSWTFLALFPFEIVSLLPSKAGHLSSINCRKLGPFHPSSQEDNLSALIPCEGRSAGLSGPGQCRQAA